MTEVIPEPVFDLCRPDERKRPTEFTQLRRKVREKTQKETEERIKNNPVPTEAELRLGCFVEQIEPQAREAVLTVNRKGYSTEGSGFAGEGEFGEKHQAIEGFFTIDDETKEKLEKMGVEIRTGFQDRKIFTTIQFQPKEPDLNSMKKVWDDIAAILPDTGQPAPQSINFFAKVFRKRYTQAKPRI